MANNTSLLKPGLKTALAEALYNEIISNTNNYYYFLGKPLEWVGGATQSPKNTIKADFDTRREIVFLKKITSADISFTIPRIDWVSGQVYDQYDDLIGESVTYDVTAPDNTFDLNGTFDLSKFGRGWTVTGDGIDAGTFVDESTETVLKLTKMTIGVVSNVKITKNAASGASSIEKSKFYVLTDEKNVYKCLFNNNNSPSTVKPYATTHENIQTADGYVWKFIYTIPNSLVNKFMSLNDMPVTTATKSAFYSQGAINSVIIQAYGSGYTELDSLTVLGDGSLEDNVLVVKNVTVNDPGAGYTVAPALTVQPPYDSVAFSVDTKLSAGQYVHNSVGLIYRVVAEGVTGSAEPIHTSDEAVLNGTTTLKFAGVAPTATATLVDDKVNAVSLSGTIGYIPLTTAGSGYDPQNPPTVTFISGDGFGASAVAEVSSEGYVKNIKLTSRGSGYSFASVAIDSPVIDTITFDGSSGSVVNITNNTIIYTAHGFVTGDRVKYTVDSGTSIGGIINGGVYYVIAVDANTIKLASTAYNAAYGVAIDLTSLASGTTHYLANDFYTATASVDIFKGYGYSIVPSIQVAPPFVHNFDYQNGLIVTMGQIVRVDTRFYQVTVAGTLGSEVPISTSGTEVSGSVTLTFIGRTASLAVSTEKTKAKLVPIIESGSIVGVIAQEPGIGYTTADIVATGGTGAIIVPNLQVGNLDSRQANTELLATPGTISAIDVLHNGINYSWATVTVDGDGQGCTATAVFDNGSISKILVTNPGFGYTHATVTITGNSLATQAYARAIISPVEGHGKNAIQELFAKDIALSTTIARDKNQGFSVDNDYRQLGVIKNPLRFDNTIRYTKFSGSTCYAVTGNFVYTDISNDDIITDVDGNRFVVVAKPATAPAGSDVQLLLQAIDNKPLSIGGLLYYGTASSATISIITQPDVDKYSGEIMFIDNRSSFQPTDEQTISIKTVIRL